MARVLMISHTYPLSPESGITPFIHHIADQMALEGYEVHVLVPAHDRLDPDAFDNVTLHPFTYSRNRSIEYKAVADDKEDVSLIELTKFVRHAFAAAWKLDKQYDFDIVHAHWTVPAGIPAFLLKLLRRKKLVVHTHGRDVYNIPEIGYDVPADWRARIVLKTVLKHADHVISNSEHCFSYAKQLGATPEKSSVLPYGVDLDSFSPEQYRQELRDMFCDKNEPLLLYVGDLIYRKGVQDLIAAVGVADMPVSLCIIGQGSYRETLEEQADEMENVSFLGFTSHDELPPYMATADVLVVPSLIEAFGIVNIEALASGTPVIGADTGGIKDIVTEEVGRLFPPGDVDALIAAIEELAADNELRETLGENARQRAEERYNWKRFGKELDAIYRQLI